MEEGKEEKEQKEEKEDARVDKVVMDAEIHIFVKADGEKTVLMEVSSKVKVRVARRVLRTGESDQDVYVTSEGRMLEGSEETGSCGVRDGNTVQVVRKLRGGEVRARCWAEETRNLRRKCSRAIRAQGQDAGRRKQEISEESAAERSEHEGEELARGGTCCSRCSTDVPGRE